TRCGSRTAMAEPSSSRRGLGGYLLALPSWIVLGGFFVLPLLLMLGLSFAQRSTYGGIASIDDLGAYVASGRFLANYARSLEPIYLRIYWRSLWLAVATTVLCLLVSYPIAYWLALLAPRRWKGTLVALVVIPFWTSFLIRTYAWMLILRSEGLLNHALLALGVIHAPLPLLYNDLAVMIGLVYGELPFMILPLYASLEKLDLSLLEASRDLGASRLSTLLRVTLPLTAPGIAAGTLLVFIPSIGQFVVSDLLGGAKTVLVGNLIQNQFAVARNKPFGAAVALELTVLVLLLLRAYASYTRRRGHEALL
ncbi:MAG TPA: ABC transporter permease, partial [Thermoanaerobaculia bacterium]|nr:ABC transporter permease [Thermoanaerobaculia bacterium]